MRTKTGGGVGRVMSNPFNTCSRLAFSWFFLKKSGYSIIFDVMK